MFVQFKEDLSSFLRRRRLRLLLLLSEAQLV